MQTLTFTNSKGEIKLNIEGPVYLSRVEGISGLTSTIQSQKSPGQEGSTYEETYFDDRDITIKGYLVYESYDELNAKKRELQNIFNPKIKENILTYSNETYTKECAVVVEIAPDFFQDDKTKRTQYFFLKLRSKDHPFFVDLEFAGEYLAFIVPNFFFPLSLIDGWTIQEEGTNRKTIHNQGDVPTPLEITFNGPAVSPKIVNETSGKFIQVDVNLERGDKLIISTEFGNKYVHFEDQNGVITNAFHFIRGGSKFFQLEIGDNEISYEASEGLDTASLQLKYKTRYIGL